MLDETKRRGEPRTEGHIKHDWGQAGQEERRGHNAMWPEIPPCKNKTKYICLLLSFILPQHYNCTHAFPTKEQRHLRSIY